MVEQTKAKTIRHNFKCQFCCYSTTKKKNLHTHISRNHYDENKELLRNIITDNAGKFL